VTGIALSSALVLVMGIASHAYHSHLKLERERMRDAEAMRLRETGVAATLGKKLEELKHEFEDHRREVKAFIANARMR
jgi:hypothetical protein